MGCGGSKIKTDAHILQVTDMLSKRPDLKKYKHDATAVKNIDYMYQSTIYGGSIFLPIGREKNQVRNRENALLAEINAVNVDYLYGGGYYKIEQVKAGEDNDYFDIFILVESIEDMDLLKQLKIGKTSENQKSQFSYEEIEKSLNGFGRMIQYKSHNDSFAPENLQLIEVFEGQFRKGLMEGYCRHFVAKEKDSSMVELGFFKEGQPSGKYSSFSFEGAVLEEGIKERDQLVKQIPIGNFLTRVITTGNDVKAGNKTFSTSEIKRPKVQVPTKLR